MPSFADVSVIVCTRNRPVYLDSALESLCSRTPPGTELLVVDSASDGPATRDTALAHGVEYVRVARRGLSIARNVGLRSARGDIVVFTDDDCLAHPGWIDALMTHFDDPDVHCVTGRMLDTRGDGTGEPARRMSTAIDAMDAGHGALMAYRRRRVLEIGGFDELLGAGRELAGAEDLDMFIRVARAGGAVVFEPGSAVFHDHTREGGDYTALLRGYGRGAGAMTAKWLRIDPVLGARMGVRLWRRSFTRSVRRLRDPRLRAGEAAFRAGMREGRRMAARLRIDGQVFTEVETMPPPGSTTPLARTEAA